MQREGSDLVSELQGGELVELISENSDLVVEDAEYLFELELRVLHEGELIVHLERTESVEEVAADLVHEFGLGAVAEEVHGLVEVDEGAVELFALGEGERYDDEGVDEELDLPVEGSVLLVFGKHGEPCVDEEEVEEEELVEVGRPASEDDDIGEDEDERIVNELLLEEVLERVLEALFGVVLEAA